MSAKKRPHRTGRADPDDRGVGAGSVPVNGGRPAALKDRVGAIADKLATSIPVEMNEMTLLVHREARMLAVPGTGFVINKGDDPQEPLMLVPDNGGWRVIMCPPGIKVEVRPAGSPPVPRIYVPGVNA